MIEINPFQKARNYFEQMVSWLRSNEACGLTHSQLEEKIQVNGVEILRLLLQGYLDERSEDEIEGDCLGSDGQQRTHRRVGARRLMSLFGEVKVRAHRLPLSGTDNLTTLGWGTQPPGRTLFPWGQTKSGIGSSQKRFQ